MATLIYGKPIADAMKSEVKRGVTEYVQKGHRPPCLAVILVGEDPASKIYIHYKEKACHEVGIQSKNYFLSGSTSEDELMDLIEALNESPDVDGILVQLPLPKHISRIHVLESIHYMKDVDGITPWNQGLLASGIPYVAPCTPLGIAYMLEASKIEVSGKIVAIIGRSVLVGASLGKLLTQRDATVIQLHSKSKNPQMLCQLADIVVVACGVPLLVDASWIKPGAIVIDVGIHRLPSGLCGDVQMESVQQKASMISPVPGGVGPMTIATLVENCFRVYALTRIPNE